MNKNNPNGANQYKPDPRQSLFLSYYLDPKSETFSVCYQSAIKAGYEEEYSKSLVNLMPKWLSTFIKNNYFVRKAESNMQEFLEMDNNDPNKLKVKADISKFILERLDRKKYSTRTEFGLSDEVESVKIEIVKNKDGDKTKEHNSIPEDMGPVSEQAE